VMALRKRSPALRNCSEAHVEVKTLPEQKGLLMQRWQPQDEEILLFASCASEPVTLVPPLPAGRWQKVLDSEAEHYGGLGSEGLPAVLQTDEQNSVVLAPFAFAVYRREQP